MMDCKTQIFQKLPTMLRIYYDFEKMKGKLHFMEFYTKKGMNWEVTSNFLLKKCAGELQLIIFLYFCLKTI